MSINYLLFLISIPMFSCFCLVRGQSKEQDSSILVRNYCTEIGRFDLWFYDDEISGSYVLLPKESLGAIWGKLENREMKGRWIDGDGAGDIIIQFNEDFSWFTTSYRSDKNPEKWYTDSWHGQLRPDQEPKFQVNKKVYVCE